jgi:hypothetical protein
MRVIMPPLHRKQDDIRISKARFKVVSCGRRFGKTLLGVVLAISCALAGGAVWWVGPTSREAGIGWRAMKGLAQQIPGVVVKAADRQIVFPGGGWIAVLSAQSQTLRGEGLDLIIIDEAAFLPGLLNVWQEDLRAALSDRRGAAMFISSPNGRGDFYTLWQRGSNIEHPDWKSWQASTYDNPFIPKSEIDAARRELPDWVFRQEYLAEFVTFAGKVYKSFDPAGPMIYDEREPLGSDECWGGIDFGFRNPTVVSVGRLDRDDVLHVDDGTYLRESTTADLVGILRNLQTQHNVRSWFADASEPGTIKELRLAGLPVRPAPRVTGDRDKSSIRAGIVLVETRLINGRLKFRRSLRDHIREFDVYRYPDEKSGPAGEVPLKVDDHAPDSVRYMVQGIAAARRMQGTMVVV